MRRDHDPKVDWSAAVLAEFLPRFRRYELREETVSEVSSVRLLRAEAKGSEAVEFVFRAPWRTEPFGVRLSASMVLTRDLYSSADGVPLRDSDLEAVVADIIYLLASEPFGGGEIEHVDDTGLGWRSVHCDGFVPNWEQRG